MSMLDYLVPHFYRLSRLIVEPLIRGDLKDYSHQFLQQSAPSLAILEARSHYDNRDPN